MSLLSKQAIQEKYSIQEFILYGQSIVNVLSIAEQIKLLEDSNAQLQLKQVAQVTKGIDLDNLPESSEKEKIKSIKDEVENKINNKKALNEKEQKKVNSFQSELQFQIERLAIKHTMSNLDKINYNQEDQKNIQENQKLINKKEQELYNEILLAFNLNPDKTSNKAKKSIAYYVFKEEENDLNEIADFFTNRLTGQNSRNILGSNLSQLFGAY
jgi:hypothetical protein